MPFFGRFSAWLLYHLVKTFFHYDTSNALGLLQLNLDTLGLTKWSNSLSPNFFSAVCNRICLVAQDLMFLSFALSAEAVIARHYI